MRLALVFLLGFAALCAAQPAIQISYKGSVLNTGNFRPLTVNLGATSQNRNIVATFNIQNTGTVSLTVSPASFCAVAGPFQCTTCNGLTLAGGASGIITITLSASSQGSFSTCLSIPNTDPVWGSVQLLLSGSVGAPAPQISTNPACGSTVLFGTTIVGVPVVRNIVISNLGGSVLVPSATAPNDFSLSTLSPIAPSGSLQLQVTLLATITRSGATTTSFALNSNDPNVPVCTFTFTATVNPASPITKVTDSLNVQLNSGTTVTFSQAFGNVPLPSVKTFTLSNTGTANLVLGTPVVPNGYSVAKFPTSLAVSQSQQFSITFLPPDGAFGSYNGAFSWTSNDAANNPFILLLSGQYVSNAASAQILFLNPDPDQSVTGGVADVGLVALGGSASAFLQLSNLGDSTLILSNITLAGASEWVLLSPLSGYPINVLGGQSLPVTAAFQTSFSSSTGTKTSVLSFSFTNFPTQTVTLSATIPASVCGLSLWYNPSTTSDQSVNLGNGNVVEVGNVAIPQAVQFAVVVKNSGTADCTGFSISSPNGAQFLDNNFSTLIAGQSAQIFVALPNISGAQTQDFNITATSGSITVGFIARANYGPSPVETGFLTVFYTGGGAYSQAVVPGSSNTINFYDTNEEVDYFLVNNGRATLTIKSFSVGSIQLLGTTKLQPGDSVVVAAQGTTSGANTVLADTDSTARATFSASALFVEIVSNPLGFTVSDTPYFQVSGPNGVITTNSFVSFGTTAVGKPVVKTFIVNAPALGNGSQPASRFCVVLSNLRVLYNGFSLAAGFTTNTICLGSSTSFYVELPATSTGSFQGLVAFETNDPNLSEFEFTLTSYVGTGNVGQDTFVVQSLDGEVIPNDGTVTFPTLIPGTSDTETYIIRNLQPVRALVVGVPTVTGNFQLTGNSFASGSQTIPPGGELFFEILATAKTSGEITGHFNFEYAFSGLPTIRGDFDMDLVAFVSTTGNCSPSCPYSYVLNLPTNTGVYSRVTGDSIGPQTVQFAPQINVPIPSFIYQRQLTWTFYNPADSQSTIFITQKSTSVVSEIGPFEIPPGSSVSIVSTLRDNSQQIVFEITGICCSPQLRTISAKIFQCEETYLGQYAENCAGTCLPGCTPTHCGRNYTDFSCPLCDQTSPSNSLCAGLGTSTCTCLNATYQNVVPPQDYNTAVLCSSVNFNSFIGVTCSSNGYLIAGPETAIRVPLLPVLGFGPHIPTLLIAQATVTDLYDPTETFGNFFQLTNFNGFLETSGGLSLSEKPFEGVCAAGQVCSFGIDYVLAYDDDPNAALFLNVGYGNSTGKNGTASLSARSPTSFNVSFAFLLVPLNNPIPNIGQIQQVNGLSPVPFSVATPSPKDNPYKPVDLKPYNVPQVVPQPGVATGHQGVILVVSAASTVVAHLFLVLLCIVVSVQFLF